MRNKAGLLTASWSPPVCMITSLSYGGQRPQSVIINLVHLHSRPRTAFQSWAPPRLLSPRALPNFLPDRFHFWTYIQGFPHLWHTRFWLTTTAQNYKYPKFTQNTEFVVQVWLFLVQPIVGITKALSRNLIKQETKRSRILVAILHNLQERPSRR
jgi:hypothetical protein